MERPLFSKGFIMRFMNLIVEVFIPIEFCLLVYWFKYSYLDISIQKTHTYVYILPNISTWHLAFPK
jgi:hypothetical protein